jgi:hypothetical protein
VTDSLQEKTQPSVCRMALFAESFQAHLAKMVKTCLIYLDWATQT